MKKSFKKNRIQVFLIILILLLSTKIDFRFDEINPGSFVDDAEYYYHSQTIGIDFDLDYSNQMPDTPNRNLNKDDKEKTLPVHSIGVGIFAAPFLFLSNLVSKIIDFNSFVSFNYFLYSLVPIFYIFSSGKLIEKILSVNHVEYSKLLLYLSIFGSGVSYFAFERFSMSHVYEFFGTTFLIYLVTIHQSKTRFQKIILEIFIPVFMFVALTVRWSNYFLLIVPFFYKYLINKDTENFYKKFTFIFGFFLGLALFLLHTKYLYGIYTINPSDIFLQVESRISNDYYRFFDLNRFFENIIYILRAAFIINFSQEFGLFYFSPILFFGYFSIFYFLLKGKFTSFLIVSLIQIFPFFSTLVLNNPGYSYGYRYMYSTIPVFIILFFISFQHKNIIKNYIFVFSIFAYLSILFFESSELAVLSSDYVTNSFGLYTKYVNPTYLSGILNSFLIFDSYLNVIFTSFLGVFIIKILSHITEPYSFIEQFRPLTEDISDLINNSLNFSWSMFTVLILFFLIISLNLINDKT